MAEMHLDSPKGLGDALYLRAVVLHLLERGHQVTVYSRWPAVFADLPISVGPRDEKRDAVVGLRHVTFPMGHALPDGATSQFDACCRFAGLTEPVALRMNWRARNPERLRQIQAAARGRPILVYQSSRVPKNPEQQALRPRREAFNAFLHGKGKQYFRIRLGHPPYIEDDPDAPRDLDLYGRTSIHEAFDIGTIGDLFFGEHGFVPMMGEALDKPCTFMFSRESQRSTEFPRLRNFNAARMIHNKHRGAGVFDD